MRKKNLILVIVLSILMGMITACTNVNIQTVTPVVQQETLRVTEKPSSSEKVEPTLSLTEKPTSTEKVEPTQPAFIEPTATQPVFMDYGDMLIYRGNAAHTGVYQSAAAKTMPEILWKFDTGNAIFNSAPVIYEDTAFLGNETGFFALDIPTGQQKWQIDTPGSVLTSASISDDMIYFGSDGGLFYAVECESGEPVWTFETGSDMRSSPLIFEGTVYFGSDEGVLYALDALTGVELWYFEVEGIENAEMGFQKTVRTAPVVANDIVLFGSNQIGGASSELVFYALDSKSGEKLWSYPAWNMLNSPVIEQDTVYFGTFMKLTGLDIETGSVVFQYGIDELISMPAIEDGIAYFGCEYGQLRALDLHTGKEL